MSRDPLDRYYTPAWPTRLLLWSWRHLGIIPSASLIGEPCAGRGDICAVLEEEGHRALASDIEPREELLERWEAPSLDVRDLEAFQDRYAKVDAIVTNPPYSSEKGGTAAEALDPMLSLEKPLAALLAIHWLEPCADRLALFAKYGEPDRIMVIPRVQYDKFALERGEGGNPGASAWIQWNLGEHISGLPRIYWMSPKDRDIAKGQIDWIENLNQE